MKILIPKSWQKPLATITQAKSYDQLLQFVLNQKALGKEIYPETGNIFRALKLTPFEQVKIVILGQDPYHGLGQANGLSFSVNPGVKIPPSLRNIYKEIEQDLSVNAPKNGDLSHWAKQGVLLLNSVLTVEAQKAGSHAKQGWEQFTDALICSLNQAPRPIIFLLWGAYAQKKAALIDPKHSILSAPHPSPLSAHRGFFGCKHFSKANQILGENGQTPIQWTL